MADEVSDGYARVSGRPGVLVTTSRPGITGEILHIDGGQGAGH